MLSLLWRTDVHWRAHTPESRKDDWVETVARKTIECGEIARRYQCLAVLDGGDLFDDKLPVRTPHRLVSRVARIHAAYPCDTYGNVGNHDVRLGKLDNLPENPLETLFASGAIKRLYDDFLGARGELSIVGDFDPAEVETIMTDALSGW